MSLIENELNPLNECWFVDRPDEIRFCFLLLFHHRMIRFRLESGMPTGAVPLSVSQRRK